MNFQAMNGSCHCGGVVQGIHLMEIFRSDGGRGRFVGLHVLATWDQILYNSRFSDGTAVTNVTACLHLEKVVNLCECKLILVENMEDTTTKIENMSEMH